MTSRVVVPGDRGGGGRGGRIAGDYIAECERRPVPARWWCPLRPPSQQARRRSPRAGPHRHDQAGPTGPGEVRIPRQRDADTPRLAPPGQVDERHACSRRRDGSAGGCAGHCRAGRMAGDGRGGRAVGRSWVALARRGQPDLRVPARCAPVPVGPRAPCDAGPSRAVRGPVVLGARGVSGRARPRRAGRPGGGVVLAADRTLRCGTRRGGWCTPPPGWWATYCCGCCAGCRPR